MSAEALIPVFMPSLVAILLRREQDKGSPLTEDEVIAIRDKSTAVMTPRPVAVKIAEQRGYDDIDPEDCWAQWQEIRKTLI